MREIKFRFWHKRLGKYVQDMHNYCPCLVNGMISQHGHIVEQSTGLKDVNGIEIFEGDKVSSWRGKPKVVAFNQSDMKTSICLISSTGNITDIGTSCDQYLKVVGNVNESGEKSCQE